MKYRKIKKQRQYLILVLFLVFIFASNSGYAQGDRVQFEQLMQQDSTGFVEAILFYPEQTRDHIFEVAGYPEALFRIHTLQENSSQEFTELLSVYSKEKQEKIWELTRYPGLIDKVVKGSQNSNIYKREIDKLLENYPEAIHRDVKGLSKTDLSVLGEIDQLNNATNAAFESLIAAYPGQIQAAFREMIKLPEAISLLTGDMDAVIIIGDTYKKYPDWVKNETDSLSLELARQNARELEDWKKSLENDPEAMEEFVDAAEEFAAENGYDEEEYEEETAVMISYPYPYWFGYPHWEPLPYWYPGPLRFNAGFYYGSGGTVVIVGFPSFYFSTWFSTGHHHRYPRLSEFYRRHPIVYSHSRLGNHKAVNTQNHADRRTIKATPKQATVHKATQRQASPKKATVKKTTQKKTTPKKTTVKKATKRPANSTKATRSKTTKASRSKAKQGHGKRTKR